jgi:hypothetical protein
MMSTRARFALAAAVLAVLGTTFARANPAATPDHLKCVEVKDLVTLNNRVTADLLPSDSQFAEQNCRIRLRGGHFCFPTEKSNVLDDQGQPVKGLEIEADNPGDFFCYLITCKRDGPKGGIPVTVRDQFGQREIHVKDADFVCAPAIKGTAQPTPTPTEVPPTETGTPTPTPTATPQGCGLQGNTCGGECPTAGDTCLFVGQLSVNGTCQCLPAAAGCALQPSTTGNTMQINIGMCAGFCPGPNDVCTAGPFLTGRADLPGCFCQPQV